MNAHHRDGSVFAERRVVCVFSGRQLFERPKHVARACPSGYRPVAHLWIPLEGVEDSGALRMAGSAVDVRLPHADRVLPQREDVVREHDDLVAHLQHDGQDRGIETPTFHNHTVLGRNTRSIPVMVPKDEDTCVRLYETFARGTCDEGAA